MQRKTLCASVHLFKNCIHQNHLRMCRWQKSETYLLTMLALDVGRYNFEHSGSLHRTKQRMSQVFRPFRRGHLAHDIILRLAVAVMAPPLKVCLSRPTTDRH